MPPISNVGGSITGAVFLSIAALGARLVLRRPAKGDHDAQRTAQLPEASPRFLAHISPAALQLLVETQALPHVVVQVYESEEPPPLPTTLAPHSLLLTPSNCIEVLSGPVPHWQQHTWAQLQQATAARGSAHAAGGNFADGSNGSSFVSSISGSQAAGMGGAAGVPRQQELVCVVGYTATATHHAACALAVNGFHRVTVTIMQREQQLQPNGRTSTSPERAAGQEADGASMQPSQQQPAATSLQAPGRAANAAVDVQYLTRDGLAVLRGYCQQLYDVPHVLLDVRRHDERALFGMLRGCVHVPVEELPSALALTADEFQALYRFPQPQPGRPLVLCSRTSRRAAWAAQVCADAGLWPVYVYRHGTYGWRLDESVQPYKQYRVGDAPPEPEAFQLEVADEAKGVRELVQCGLLPPAMLQ